MAGPKGGRPRVAPDWESKMRYTTFVSYASDKDVHTALFQAGVDHQDLIIAAVREYIVNHELPAGNPDVQKQIVDNALHGKESARAYTPPPAPAPTTPPASEPVVVRQPVQQVEILRPAQPAPAPSPSPAAAPGYTVEPVAMASGSSPEAQALAFARAQLADS